MAINTDELDSELARMLEVERFEPPASFASTPC